MLFSCCRPYLQPGAAERCLLLLNELLAAAQLLEISGRQGEQQHPMLDWLAAVVSSGAEELASYASMAAAPLWQQPQQLQPAREEAGRQQGSTAQLALTCVCNSLQLLALLDCCGGPASERLLACCLGALQGYAASAGAPSTPGQQAAAGPSDGSAWQRAAAPLQPLASCGAALAAAMEAGWLSAAEQQPTLEAAAEAAVAALASVLSLQAAAAAAAAGSSSKQTSGLAAYCHRLCWKAVASLLILLQQLRLAGPSHGLQQQWEEQQAAALADALNGLQRASGAPALAADYRGLLLQLRCCRLLLPTTLQQKRVAQLALAQRQHAAASATGQAGSEPNLELATWVCSAAWQAYEAAAAAAKRRRSGLTAALASTCLHPALFSGSVSDGGSPAEAAAAALALHGPAGPIQQLLGRLLDLGAKSWRTMSIVSLQASTVLSPQPAPGPCLHTHTIPPRSRCHSDDLHERLCLPVSPAALRPAGPTPGAGRAVQPSIADAAAVGRS